jgi:hypothetical protein
MYMKLYIKLYYSNRFGSQSLITIAFICKKKKKNVQQGVAEKQWSIRF